MPVEDAEDGKGRNIVLKAGIGMSEFVNDDTAITFLTSATGAIRVQKLCEFDINKHTRRYIILIRYVT